MAAGALKEESVSSDIPLREWLEIIQSRIMDIGSVIATPDNEHTTQTRIRRIYFEENHVVDLENWIDKMEEHLPPLRNFILPGGGASGYLHVARTICRRTERSTLRISEQIPEPVLKYLNR